MGGHEGYTTVGLFEDGTPGELFITMAKEGSTIGGLMDVIGTLTSMALQYGVPLEVLINKFAHMRFEPSGWTSNPDIPNAKSVVDYIFRWLGIQFLPGYREANTPNRNLAAAEVPDTPEAVKKHVEDFIDRQLNGCGERHQRPRERQPVQRHRQSQPGSTGRKFPAHSRGRACRRPRGAERAIRPLPIRCPRLRQLRSDHRPQRQLLSLPQLRQQHGLQLIRTRH